MVGQDLRVLLITVILSAEKKEGADRALRRGLGLLMRRARSKSRARAEKDGQKQDDQEGEVFHVESPGCWKFCGPMASHIIIISCPMKLFL